MVGEEEEEEDLHGTWALSEGMQVLQVVVNDFWLAVFAQPLSAKSLAEYSLPVMLKTP